MFWMYSVVLKSFIRDNEHCVLSVIVRAVRLMCSLFCVDNIVATSTDWMRWFYIGVLPPGASWHIIVRSDQHYMYTNTLGFHVHEWVVFCCCWAIDDSICWIEIEIETKPQSQPQWWWWRWSYVCMDGTVSVVASTRCASVFSLRYAWPASGNESETDTPPTRRLCTSNT